MWQIIESLQNGGSSGKNKKGMELSTLAYIILIAFLCIILVAIFLYQVAGKILGLG